MIGVALAILATWPASSTPVTVPERSRLEAQIEAADHEFFHLFFEGVCDVPKMRSMVADDVEFYHDKGGFDVHNADQFVAIFEQNCKSREDATNWRSRRELVRASLHVDPVPGYGAIQTGEHLFYERHGAKGQEKLAGKARFAHVWALGSDGKWRLSRILSYDHHPAQ